MIFFLFRRQWAIHVTSAPWATCLKDLKGLGKNGDVTAVYTSDAEQVAGRNHACGLTFLGVVQSIHPNISAGTLRGVSSFRGCTQRRLHVYRNHVEERLTYMPSVRTKAPLHPKNHLAWPEKHALSALKQKDRLKQEGQGVYILILLNCIKNVHSALDESKFARDITL